MESLSLTDWFTLIVSTLFLAGGITTTFALCVYSAFKYYEKLKSKEIKPYDQKEYWH